MDDALPLPGLEPEPKKRCSMCREWLPIDQFHRDRSKPDGLQNRCKPCNIEVNKQWYRKNPSVRGRRMDGYAKRRRDERHRQLWQYLCEHPCVDCGEGDPVVLEEISKCEVVCANCHRRRTAERLQSRRYRWSTEG